MLKANELRIGNYIRLYDKNFNLSNEGPVVTASDILAISVDKCRADPITLTEEWLVKFGFEISNSETTHNLRVAKISGFYINTYATGYIGYWWLGYYHNRLNAHIKYVYQLQNLYFALTGEELELK